MSQYASGVDEEGVLQIDVIVRGEVPDLSNGMELTLTPYYENYIQTGQGERTPALILISQMGKQAAPQLCFWIHQHPLRKWQSPLKKC